MSAFPTLIVPDQLSPGQRLQTEALAHACCQAGGFSLSYPSLEEGCRHYLLAGPGGQLLAALAVVPYEEGLAECCAFTLPEHRQKGYFSALLDRALEDWEDWELLFAVEEGCTDARAVLETLGAVPHQQELQMEWRGNAAAGPAPDPSLRLRETPSGNILCTADSPDALGSCQVFPLSPESVCLHHVEICPALRGRGLGTAMVRLLLERLSGEGISHVVLHVSGDNAPAVALYKKTGFCITKTLSYYLY